MNDKLTANPRDLLRRMFDAAIEAAQPIHCLPKFLPAPPRGRLIVIGIGKASAAMAKAFEDSWTGGDFTGLALTRYGYQVPCQRIEVIEAAHPVPDAAGLAASQRILEEVKGLTPEDTVLFLISGGGSALLTLPIDGISLEDKQAVNRVLLKSGATITEMNAIRRHLSAIKGGRLAAACHPAKVINLLISDVPGDHPGDIASGPTVPDATTCEDALALVRRYHMDLPASAMEVLTSGRGESIKPDDPRMANIETHLITTPQIALEAAAQIAREAGIAPYILGDSIEGEARDIGKVLAGLTHQIVKHHQPFATPCVLLSGGEATVTLRGSGGRGGRNVEFLLSFGVALDGLPGVYALAGDTDGVDGQEEIAGAILAPDSLERAWQCGIAPKEALANNDGHGFFSALGDSVITGPTLTNVNDFRAILVL